MLTIITLLITGLLVVATPSFATVTFSNPPELTSTVCEPVNITCLVVDQPSFAWFLGGLSLIELETFSYPNRDVVFPLTIYNQSSIVINVMTASSESRTNILFNATSVLSTTTSVLQMMNVNRIQCGNVGSSDVINLTLNVQAIPQPLFNCSITSSTRALDLSIRWSSRFTFEHAVENYHVSVTPDPSSCSSNQVSPSQVYTCSGLVSDETYTFVVSGNDCGDQQGRNTSLVIHPQVPRIPSKVDASPVYNEDADLIEIGVTWTEEPQTHISNCSSSQLTYTVSLVDMGKVIQEQNISSDSCSNRICAATFLNFDIEEGQNFRVNLTASNGVGQSQEHIQSDTDIGTSLGASTSISSSNCTTFVVCASPESNGSCSIQYGQDNLFTDYQPISLAFNSSIALPFIAPSTYYYEVTVTIESFTSIIKGNFRNRDGFAARLTGTNQGLLASALLFFFISIIITVFLIIVEVIMQKGSCLSLVLLVIDVVLLVVCVILWIAVCVVVIPQDNTCDLAWQSRRDALILSAHLFSDTAFLTVLASFIMTCLAGKFEDENGYKKFIQPCVRKTSPAVIESEKTVLDEQMELHSQDEWKQKQKEGKGGRIPELEQGSDLFASKGVTHKVSLLKEQENIYKEYTKKLNTETEVEYAVTEQLGRRKQEQQQQQQQNAHYLPLDRLGIKKENGKTEAKEEGYSTFTAGAKIEQQYSDLKHKGKHNSQVKGHGKVLTSTSDTYGKLEETGKSERPAEEHGRERRQSSNPTGGGPADEATGSGESQEPATGSSQGTS